PRSKVLVRRSKAHVIRPNDLPQVSERHIPSPGATACAPRPRSGGGAVGAPRHPSPVDFGTAHSTQMKPAEDSMSKLRVHNFAISLDGYGAGPRQGLEHPL